MITIDIINKEAEKENKKEIIKQLKIGEKDYKIIARYVKYNKNKNLDMLIFLTVTLLTYIFFPIRLTTKQTGKKPLPKDMI